MPQTRKCSPPWSTCVTTPPCLPCGAKHRNTDRIDQTQIAQMGFPLGREGGNLTRIDRMNRMQAAGLECESGVGGRSFRFGLNEITAQGGHDRLCQTGHTRLCIAWLKLTA